MVITIIRAVNGIEDFAETIRALFARDWDATKTGNVTPTFMSAHGEGTAAPGDKKSPSAFKMKKNKGIITFKTVATRQEPTESSSAHDLIGFSSDVFIRIMCQDTTELTLFEEEVYRILLEANPNSATKIKKTGNTDDSAIQKFGVPVINWDRPPEIEEFISKESQGTLVVYWSKSKS